MKEIGGYIEFEGFHLSMLHDDGIALNCGRNCLAYLFKSRGIKKIKVPYYICNSVYDICTRENVDKYYYHIDSDFLPAKDLVLEDDEWLYLVNFYGQLSNEIIQEYIDCFGRVIVDQANDYFANPIPGVDTLYTCRKWFGVADGAFLYTNDPLPDDFPTDESFERMRFLLGRYERTASEFYEEYTLNNKLFANQPIKRMSKLTTNLLHGIDYKAVKNIREKNFNYLHEKLGRYNQLHVKPATFMYPFMVDDGPSLRRKLQAEKIYIPTLWPTVFDIAAEGSLEYKMAENILPLPVDQRYGLEDMELIIKKIKEYLHII